MNILYDYDKRSNIHVLKGEKKIDGVEKVLKT
jgi:hypothetical protein